MRWLDWRQAARAALVLSCGAGAACSNPSPVTPPGGGGGGGTMTVQSTAPADAATGVDVTSEVKAFLSVAPSGPSATVTSVQLVTDATGIDAPRTVRALVADKSVTMDAALLPGVTYRATLTTALQGTGGERLAAGYTWRFTMRAPVAASIGTTAAPAGGDAALAVDTATGRLHAAWPVAGTAGVAYATCLTACSTAGNWTAPLVLDATDSVTTLALATGPDGSVHLLYRRDDDNTLRYATCAGGDCTTAGFTSVQLESSFLGAGVAPSLAVRDDGTLHATWYYPTLRQLRYATCASACTTASNWQVITLDGVNDMGARSALAIDATGTLHVVYTDLTANTFRYATCAGGCATLANWSIGTITGSTQPDAPSLWASGTGRLELSYRSASDGTFHYALCTGTCTAQASWVTTDLVTGGTAIGLASSVRSDLNGKVHLLYQDVDNNRLQYATCASGCDLVTRWRSTPLATGAGVGSAVAAALSKAGRLQFLFVGADSVAMRYAE